MAFDKNDASAAFDLLDALDSVTWYNGLAPIVFSWRDTIVLNPKTDSSYNAPKNYGSDEIDWGYHQLQVLWMIAVWLFGDYGTSPRFGWIDDVDGFRKWCLDITRTWRGSEEYDGPEEYRRWYLPDGEVGNE